MKEKKKAPAGPNELMSRRKTNVKVNYNKDHDRKQKLKEQNLKESFGKHSFGTGSRESQEHGKGASYKDSVSRESGDNNRMS